MRKFIFLFIILFSSHSYSSDFHTTQPAVFMNNLGPLSAGSLDSFHSSCLTNTTATVEALCLISGDYITGLSCLKSRTFSDTLPAHTLPLFSMSLVACEYTNDVCSQYEGDVAYFEGSTSGPSCHLGCEVTVTTHVNSTQGQPDVITYSGIYTGSEGACGSSNSSSNSSDSNSSSNNSDSNGSSNNSDSNSSSNNSDSNSSSNSSVASSTGDSGGGSASSTASDSNSSGNSSDSSETGSSSAASDGTGTGSEGEGEGDCIGEDCGEGGAGDAQYCDARPQCDLEDLACHTVLQVWYQRCPEVEELTDEQKGDDYAGAESHALDIDEKIEDSKTLLEDKINEIKEDLIALVEMDISSGSGSLTCETINLYGATVGTGLCRFESFFSSIRTVILAAFSLLAIFIIFRV